MSPDCGGKEKATLSLPRPWFSLPYPLIKKKKKKTVGKTGIKKYLVKRSKLPHSAGS